MECNATIEMGGRTLTCLNHRPKAARPHTVILDAEFHTWNDDAPGATPHQDPTPRYTVINFHGNTWGVLDEHDTNHPYDDPTNIVTFHGAHGQHEGHPDPEGAAKAHAEYLNGDGGPELAARVMLQRMHDAAARSDHFREALEKIAAFSWAGPPLHTLVEVARKALEEAP